MSSRLHNKFHRHNHHTNSTNDPRYPDASYDPRASYTSNFNGPFVVKNPNNPDLTTQSTTNTPNVAIDVAGDIAATGNIYAAGAYYGDGSQLALGNNTSLIATVTGTPYTFGATNPVTSIVTSLSSAGNAARASYSTVAGGSANQINGSANFSFIAAGSGNQTNISNTFILGSNITASLPNYTYVNNLSSLGSVYATVIGASAINAVNFVGNGNGINLSTSSLSATTTTLVNNTSANLVTLTNTVSTTLNASITSLGASYVSNTSLQNLSGNWQNVYSLVNTTTATTFRVNNLSATGFVNAVSANLGSSSIAALNVSPLTITGAANGSVFNQIQNTVAGVSASTDISLYNNDGINYLDLGIASASYNGNLYSPVFNVVKAGDSYVYATSGNLVVGAANTASNLTFFTGGTLSANERMRITNTGNVGVGTAVPNSKLTVVGDISATGAVYSTNTGIIGSSTYYVTSTNFQGISASVTSSNTSFGGYKPVFSTLPSASADYLAPNAVYEIVYNIFNYTGAVGAGYYFAVSASDTFTSASLIFNSDNEGSSGSNASVGGGTNYSAVQNGTVVVTKKVTPETASNNNFIELKSVIVTGNTPMYVWLIAASQSSTYLYTMTILANSYRKVTRIA